MWDGRGRECLSLVHEIVRSFPQKQKQKQKQRKSVGHPPPDLPYSITLIISLRYDWYVLYLITAVR